MRRVLFFGVLILLVLSLAACDDNNSDLEMNTVTNAKLTEREEIILSSTANQSFVFDFNVEDNYKEVTVWVEKYESGNLVGEVTRISTEINKMGMLIFSTSHTAEESDQTLFTVSINSDGTTGTGSSSETIIKNNSGIVSGSNPLGSISIKDKMVLADICYSSSKEEVHTLSTDFYTDMDNHIDELKKYDVAYLLRSEFK
ncbi:hypothetical protein [Metabacillus fastidiosus]|uniref:hypothetical protein n=1 Tax=Metabacillus fastidiosus TaxID=1458 RepID=UPI002DBE1CAE|nr:hypothetical protein [Metabacillus fastidiosus]MEC2078490.1 hypothetical protein [Metabacillus fastidiosus]